MFHQSSAASVMRRVDPNITTGLPGFYRGYRGLVEKQRRPFFSAIDALYGADGQDGPREHDPECDEPELQHYTGMYKVSIG